GLPSLMRTVLRVALRRGPAGGCSTHYALTPDGVGKVYAVGPDGSVPPGSTPSTQHLSRPASRLHVVGATFVIYRDNRGRPVGSRRRRTDRKLYVGPALDAQGPKGTSAWPDG